MEELTCAVLGFFKEKNKYSIKSVIFSKFKNYICNRYECSALLF